MGNNCNNTINVRLEDEIDMQFIKRVQAEVTQSCALPFALPIERIPEFCLQAAQYFWANDDYSAEERFYIIKNSDICKGNKLNKIVQLPQQILGVHGVFKLQQNLRYGTMGDFSLERMMMSTYSMFGGAGTVVPITGFSNAVVSPAIEFKKEGFVFGVAAKMFTIAGPVLVYGIGSSVIVGIIYYFIQLWT